MAYAFHIVRDDDLAIGLSDWRAAVDSTNGVRLFTATEHLFRNPRTAELVSIDSYDGDAEVLFPDGKWYTVFQWRGESAVFAARFDPTETSHPVWKAAVALATYLRAVIRGDEGEVYNFQTGKVTGR